MCTKGIHSRMSITTVNRYPGSTLDQHFIDTRLSLHRHLVWHSIDTTVDQVSIECPLNIDQDFDWVWTEMLIEGVDHGYQSTLDHGCQFFYWCRSQSEHSQLTINRLLIKCRSSVHQVSIRILIDTLLILDRHSINTSVDTRSTRYLHLCWQLVESWLIFYWCTSQSTLSWLSTDCW